MRDFNTGDRVKVEYEGTIVDAHVSSSTISVRDDSGGISCMHHYKDVPVVKITRIYPEVSAGELYETPAGNYFFVVESHTVMGMCFISKDGVQLARETFWTNYPRARKVL